MTQQIKALIVDDSAFARSIIVKRLGVDPGIEIIGVAKDGVDALEKIKTLKPDVVTLDISMPRMSRSEIEQAASKSHVLRIRCEGCERTVRIKPTSLGKRVKCGKCQHVQSSDWAQVSDK